MKRVIVGSTAPKFSVKDIFNEVKSYYDEEDIRLAYQDNDNIVFTVNGQKCSVRHYSEYDEAGLSYAITEKIDTVLDNRAE